MNCLGVGDKRRVTFCSIIIFVFISVDVKFYRPKIKQCEWIPVHKRFQSSKAFCGEDFGKINTYVKNILCSRCNENYKIIIQIQTSYDKS